MSLGTVIKDNLESLLAAIGGVVVALVAWTLLQVYEINATVARLATTSEQHSNRLDAFRDALPDIRVKIAREEISRPLKAAVVVTAPSQMPSGDWVTLLHILNKGRRSSFLVSLEGPDDKAVAYLMSGCARSFDPDALSFGDLERAARDAGQPTSAPDFVMGDSSFAVFRSKGGFAGLCSDTLMKHRVVLKRSDATHALVLTSWETLAKDLNAGESYRVIK